MEYNNERIRKNLKFLIEEYGTKQKDLAERLSVTPKTVTAWLKGNNAIRKRHLIDIANYFHISFDSLVFDDITKPLEDRVTNDRLKAMKSVSALIRYYESLGYTFEYLNTVRNQDEKTIIDRPKGVRITWNEEDHTITETVSSSEFDMFIRNMHNRAILEIKLLSGGKK